MAKKEKSKEVEVDESLEDAPKGESVVEDKEHNAQSAEEVEVLMTPEQRDEFVKFVADKKEQQKALEEKNEKVYVMDLVYGHNINGQGYGPGLAHVPGSVLPIIQRGEQRQVRREIALHTSNKRLFKVLQSGQAVLVKPS